VAKDNGTGAAVDESVDLTALADDPRVADEAGAGPAVFAVDAGFYPMATRKGWTAIRRANGPADLIVLVRPDDAELVAALLTFGAAALWHDVE